MAAACGGGDETEPRYLDVFVTVLDDPTSPKLRGNAEVSTETTRQVRVDALAAATDYIDYQNAGPLPMNLPADCSYTKVSDDEPSRFAQEFLPLPEANLDSGTIRAEVGAESIEFTDEMGQSADLPTAASSVTIDVGGDGDFPADSRVITGNAPDDYDISLDGDVITVVTGPTPIDLRVSASTGFVGFSVECDELADTTFTVDIDALLADSAAVEVYIDTVGADEEVTIQNGSSVANMRVLFESEAITTLRENSVM